MTGAHSQSTSAVQPRNTVAPEKKTQFNVPCGDPQTKVKIDLV